MKIAKNILETIGNTPLVRLNKIVKDVSDEMLIWKTEGTKLYQKLPKNCFESLKECKPNSKKTIFSEDKVNYKTWNKTKK